MNHKMMFMAVVIGMAMGSVITWRIVKNRYEQIVQEEIDSVKEVFSKRKTKECDEMGKKVLRGFENGLREKDDLMKQYSEKLQKEGYINYSGTEAEKEKRKIQAESPYIITPEEFGEFEEYERISLTYYSDGVLADENDELVEDVEEVVGFDSFNHFGEYEDDSVFVRNEAKKCDYEILLDYRRYSDVIKNMPHRMEVQ